MLLIDAILRYATCTILLLIVLLVLRDARHSLPSRLAALVALSMAALLMGTAYPGLELPIVPHTIIRFLDAPSVGLIWWFGLSLFEDDFRLGRREWAGMLLILLPTIVFRFHDLGYISGNLDPLLYFGAFISTGLMLHLVYVTLKGRRDDVIESRRKVRVYFTLALVLATLLIIISERLFSPEYDLELSLFRVIITLPMALWAFLWVVQLHAEKLEFVPLRTRQVAGPVIDPRDQSLHDQLLHEMRHEQAYRQSGLTISLLAERLNTPEHRLRALINQGMGYRNFSSFVNEYRIEAVKAAMQRAENSRLPILSMALDVGFNSLAPFNRAFKNVEGETPSEYRDKLLNKAD